MHALIKTVGEIQKLRALHYYTLNPPTQLFVHSCWRISTCDTVYCLHNTQRNDRHYINRYPANVDNMASSYQC